MTAPRLLSSLSLGSRLGSWTLQGPLPDGPYGPRWAVAGSSPQGETTGASAELQVIPVRGGPLPCGAGDRFVARMTALSSFLDPVFPTVLDSGVASDAAWVVVERTNGVPVGQWWDDLRADPNRGQRLLRLGAAWARSLDRLHGAGFLHRDICPGTLWVVAEDQPRVLGAGVCSDPWSHGVLGRDLEGDLRYKAPEQARGEDGEQRTDLYSLGASLRGIFSGRPPIEDSSSLELLARIRTRPVPFLPSSEDVSESVAASLNRAMAFRLHRRPPDGATMASWLEDAAAGRVVPPPERRLSDQIAAHKGWAVGGLCLIVVTFLVWWVARG